MIRMGDKGNRSALFHAQAAGRGIDLEVVLPGQSPDADLRLFPNERTVVQRPRDGRFGDSCQPGDISDRADGFAAHNTMIYATDCIINEATMPVK